MIGQLQPIQGHNESVRSIEFSRDGALLAGSFHRTIVLYDITTATPRVIQRLAGNEGPILAFVFSSDGTRIVSGSSDGTVRLWAVETGEPIGEPLRGELECRSIAFASDDSRIIAMGARMAIVEGAQEFDAIAQSWDISAPGHPSTIRTFSGHEGRVLSMNLSPDGAYMVTAGSDQTIRLWQADTGIPINKPFRGHTSEVLVAKFSPDGTRLISGSADRTVRIWDVNTGSPIGQPFDGHSGEVGAIVVVPGGTWVVSGSDDSSIRLWDADTVLEPRPPVDAHSASVCSVTFSTESDFVLSGSEDGSVRGWDVKTGALKDTLTVDHKAPVLSVACSPDNRRYAAATRNGTFLVGDIHSGPRLGEPMIGAKHQDAVLSVAFSYEGSFLTTSSLDRTIRTWDPDTRTLEAIGQPLTYHQNSVTEVALARTGNDHLIVSASGDMTVRLCNLGTAAVAPLTLSGHDSSVLSIASSPNGECIISGSYDKTIRVWDGCTGNMLICITGHMGPVRSVALFQSPDGTRIIASGSDDKTVRLWEANSGNPLGPPLEGHGGPVLSVCFSPNGKYVASGSANGEIRLWDIKSKWAPCINGGSGSDGSIQPSQDDYANEPNSWCLEADGWVTDRGRLLFWVSQAHHPHLDYFFRTSSHPCSLILSNSFLYGVESWDLAVGNEWQTCFNVNQNLLQAL
ncbi:quinon protein alcohol dehydrogenase-like superfamily [Rhizoctonia solani]|nr:quinon protein alcohol dehydrogenase-like superfamily [Rhizoctonia solani]